MADHHRRRILELEAERNAARRDLATAREELERWKTLAHERWNRLSRAEALLTRLMTWHESGGHVLPELREFLGPLPPPVES